MVQRQAQVVTVAFGLLGLGKSVRVTGDTLDRSWLTEECHGEALTLRIADNSVVEVFRRDFGRG